MTMLLFANSPGVVKLSFTPCPASKEGACSKHHPLEVDQWPGPSNRLLEDYCKACLA